MHDLHGNPRIGLLLYYIGTASVYLRFLKVELVPKVDGMINEVGV
jgi:hypothetical protein